MRSLTVFGLGLAFSALLTGCAFLRLDQDLKRQQMESFQGRVAVIRGQIAYDDQSGTPAVVLCFARENGRAALTDYMIINHSSLYYFIVPAGEYTVAAFEDRNRNMQPDPGEPWGVYGAPDWLPVERPGPIKGVDIVLRGIDFRASGGLLEGLSLAEVTGRHYTSGIGVVTDLDEKSFALEYALKGLWEPYAFLKEVGYGLLFLEPYDPSKTPVLFVYGAAGQARNWRPLFEGIDRTRFQPWFFSYPTGMPLELSAGALDASIRQLQETLRFRRLFVVAHSMGGLVARRALQKTLDAGGRDYLALFVSISTPWGGHRAAAQGVAHAPAVVPSWRDMVPESDFNRKLFAQPLPASLPFHLLFSYNGRSGLMAANNDGAVTLESQLDYRAQREAQQIVGVNAGHADILRDRDLHQAVNTVLLTQRQALEEGLDWRRVFDFLRFQPLTAPPPARVPPGPH
jgi:pimeloyl-ACP methyl ester carboxylesterase